MIATSKETEVFFHTLKSELFRLPEEQTRAHDVRFKYVSTSSGGVDHRFLRQQKLQEASRELLRLRALEDNWDSFGGRAPKEQAVINALATLSRLGQRHITPSHIAATDDGGILLEYFVEGRRYLWECEEDGDIGLLVRHKDGRQESADFRHSKIEQIIDRFHDG